MARRMDVVARIFRECVRLGKPEVSGIVIDAAKRILLSKSKTLRVGIVLAVSNNGNDQQQPSLDDWVW